MLLQPVFKQRTVPQLAAVEAREMLLGLGQQAIDIGSVKQASFQAASTVERIRHELVKIAAHVF